MAARNASTMIGMQQRMKQLYCGVDYNCVTMASADRAELYFGYGSSMLTERMAARLPDPQKATIAKLQGYTLVFQKYSDQWHGHLACAAPKLGASMWGVLWRLTPEQKRTILKQEEVGLGVYISKNVVVHAPDGTPLSCFFITQKAMLLKSAECRPSPQYKDVLVRGAEEHAFPDDYVTLLKTQPDNGYAGENDFRKMKHRVLGPIFSH